jgi:hypothetical protein
MSKNISLDTLQLESELVLILEARLTEAQHCLSHSPLAAIFLCGSILEGILLGVARQKQRDFNQAANSPKDKDEKVKPFRDWSLAQFIDVAHELGLLKRDVKNFSHVLRDFRNYIHPYQQMKENFSPNKSTAEICFKVLNLAINNLIQGSNISKRKGNSTWSQYQHATDLALVNLIGEWNEKSEADIAVLSKLISQSYSTWIPKAREVLHLADSPFSLKNSLWKITGRANLWDALVSLGIIP